MPPSSRDILQIEKPDVVATLLFCDVSGYARFFSGLPAAQVLGKLNHFMETVAKTVTENKGTIAKFIGDAVFAYWLEEEHADHAKLACHFAENIRARLSAVLPDFETRMGIHTGSVALVRINHGNYQSVEPYGDAVNLAARLEGFCAQEQARAMASEQVIAHGGGGRDWAKLASVIVKGQTSPLTLYQLG